MARQPTLPLSRINHPHPRLSRFTDSGRAVSVGLFVKGASYGASSGFLC